MNNVVKVFQYEQMYHNIWDEFIEKAKNGHFFFTRAYMEYHKERFQDFSLLIKNEKDQLLAVMPANRCEGSLISHGGLTFGGIITSEKMTVPYMMNIFEEVIKYLKKRRITKWIYKCIPFIYMRYPAEEDKYVMFVKKFVLVRRDVSVAIYLPNAYKYQERRKRMVNKGRKHEIIVRESHDYNSFMNLQNNVLKTRHNTLAVHTAEEISLLAARFPNNIKLYIGEFNGELLAGTILFINRDVVHTQYMANSNRGREMGALDCVLDYLIQEEYANYKYFDFGISNENQGRYLNEGLIGQKEGFGARAVVHDFYELDII